MAAPLLDSDDDAPEEITLNEGREEAELSRRNEKENSKRLAAELKEKRKARSEKKSKEGVAEGDRKSKKEVSTLTQKSRSRKRKGRETDEPNSSDELAGKVVGSVMLDESVVQLIRAREKQVGKGVGESKHKYIEEPEPEPEPEPKQKLKKTSKRDNNGPSNSRTQIVSLKAKPNAAAINGALEFRRNHFFGSQVKRSTAMLPTSRPHLASV